MPNAENLRNIFQDVLETGKFERTEVLAVLSVLIDIEDRLKRVETKCEMKPPD